MADKHIVHCRNGGKVIINGDRVEVHLDGPLVYQRSQWISYFPPAEEVRRTMMRSGPENSIAKMLEEAFRAVPQVVHRDPREDD